MNPQVIEKTIEAANNVVGALKNSPVILALVILQIATLAAISYSVITREGYVRDERKAWAEYQKHVAELLSNCAAPEK